MPTPTNGPGRPKSNRLRTVCRFTKEERTRLDQLRKSKPRGVYLGKIVMAQPLDPFDAFHRLKK